MTPSQRHLNAARALLFGTTDPHSPRRGAMDSPLTPEQVRSAKESPGPVWGGPLGGSWVVTVGRLCESHELLRAALEASQRERNEAKAKAKELRDELGGARRVYDEALFAAVEHKDAVRLLSRSLERLIGAVEAFAVARSGGPAVDWEAVDASQDAARAALRTVNAR